MSLFRFFNLFSPSSNQRERLPWDSGAKDPKKALFKEIFNFQPFFTCLVARALLVALKIVGIILIFSFRLC